MIWWEAEGTGSNTIVLTLMDPDNGSELIELVRNTGTGQIGGAELVWGNQGNFYLKVEGSDAGWEVWITQQ